MKFMSGVRTKMECEKVGIVTATTKSDIGFNRNPEKVRAELEILARNQAASMGGNAIVVRTPAAGGNQTFDAYRCQP